ncbi:MAG TPA: dihydroorotase [Prolixibacteraceae bacterium]|nr:dihydroorotase [Prolixibacteraceae bacterium]HQN93095.1 dihydroorotase [Prolixibacteraceae bacterium]
MKTLIKNVTIVNEGRTFTGSVLIENDLIAGILGNNDQIKADITIDASGQLLLPGVIDDQVHFREPGLIHKGEIYTEAKACVAGGVTSYMEMPNTIPQTTTVQLLEEKYNRAAQVSLANYSFYIGATNDNIKEVLKADPTTVCGIKCFMGSSTGNMLVEGEGLETLFKNAHMIVATHNEEESVIKANIEEYRNKYGELIPIEIHPKIRSEEACYQSTAKAIELATKYNTRLHALHLSTAKEMELFPSGLPQNKRITNEVCIHHLWFDDRDYSTFGTKIKWNPAIKSEKDKLALRDAINSNIIDIVATDHAPHTIEEKGNSYFKSPSGGPLVQHSLVAMLELVSQGVFSYEKVVEKMCHFPALLFNIEKRGFIREGYKADLVLVNPQDRWVVTPNNIFYKCQWSPFEGITFRHSVTHTFVNGTLVYQNGQFYETNKGERLRFNR